MKRAFVNYSNRQGAAEKNRFHLMLGYILKQKPNATFQKFDPSVLPYGGIFVNVSWKIGAQLKRQNRSFRKSDEPALACDVDSLGTCLYLHADSSDLNDVDEYSWAVGSPSFIILILLVNLIDFSYMFPGLYLACLPACDCWLIFSGLLDSQGRSNLE